MKVREILRVKGSALYIIAPQGRAVDAVKTMAERNMGSLVVVSDGKMVGLVTFSEILQALSRGNGTLGEVKIADIMTRKPVTTTPEMELNDLRRTMLETSARYLPVLENDRLVGVISFRDVAKAVLEEKEFENRMLKGYIKSTES